MGLAKGRLKKTIKNGHKFANKNVKRATKIDSIRVQKARKKMATPKTKNRRPKKSSKGTKNKM